jgi:hypothetical protein
MEMGDEQSLEGFVFAKGLKDYLKNVRQLTRSLYHKALLLITCLAPPRKYTNLIACVCCSCYFPSPFLLNHAGDITQEWEDINSKITALDVDLTNAKQNVAASHAKAIEAMEEASKAKEEAKKAEAKIVDLKNTLRIIAERAARLGETAKEIATDALAHANANQ